MMKGWTMKLIRRQKEGKRRSSTAVTSPINNNNVNINNNLNSCLKSFDSDDSISMRKSRESSSVVTGSGDDSLSSTSADASRHSTPSSNVAYDHIAGSASCTSKTVSTTCGSSSSKSMKKKVRFDVVKIRKYERTVSDNPCCSSGPPIGIGWKHGDINIININEYEQNRDERLTHLDIVLTREERVQLLMDWGVPIPIIAGSTRAASKAKHQRRQTVVNTRKIFKLEKAMELASTKLKRALLIPSSSSTKKQITGTTDENDTDDDDRVEKNEEGMIPESIAHHVSKSNNTFLLENDHRTAEDTMTASSYSLDDNENKETEQIHNIHVTEPDDDIIGKLDMSVKTDVTGIDANEVDDDEEDDNDNDDYTLGATTLGNNSAYTTPSTIEMENFYRKLELELFGDETELPSFVGQTLEVPLNKYTNTSSNNANNNNGMVMKEDTSSHAGTSNSNPQSAFVQKCRGVGPTPVFAADDEYRNCSYNNSPMYYNTNSAQQQQQQQESTRTGNYQHINNYHNEVGEDDYYCHPFPNHPPQAGRYEPTYHSPVDSNITNNQRYHGRSYESAGTNNDLNTHTTQNCSMYGDPDPRRIIPYPHSGIYEPMHRPMNNNSNNYRRRNGSFDDSTYNQTTAENQFLQSSSHETPMNENNYYNYRRRNGSFDDSTYNQNTTENQQFRHSSSDEGGMQYHHHAQQFRSSSFPIEHSLANNSPESSSFRRTNADADYYHHHHHHQYNKYDGGPQIRHMPFHGHLSPNQWMEGNSDGERLSYDNTTVTITEGTSP